MNLAWLRTSGGSRVSVAGFVAVALFLPRPEITSDMSGFIVFLDSLRTVLAVAGLVSCITVVGSAIVMRLHVVSVPKTLQLAAAFLIGSTVTGSLLMATGLAGLFSVDAVRVICLASTLLLAGPSALGYLRTASKGAIGELLRMREVKGGSWVLIGSALLGLFLLANALGPLFTWDAAMYHIEAPKEFLLAGAIELLPDNEHVAFVSTFQMLNSVLIASSGHAGPAVLHWLSLVLLVWLVAVLASEIDSRRTGVLALALIWSAPILLRHGSEPMTDVYLVLAILALIGWTW